MNSKTQYSLNSFIDSLANALILTKPILSVITTDSSATRPLKCIHEQSRKDPSQKELNHCSRRLLEILQQVDHLGFSLNHKKSKKSKTLSLIKPVGKKKDQKSIKLNQVESEIQWNDENVNLSNFQPTTHNYKQLQPPSDSSESFQLRQIIRPEYRRSLEPQQLYVTSRAYLSSEDDNDDLPIFHRKQREDSRSDSKSDRSVSPKVQGRRKLKSNLVNISTISRGLQTNSDVSFQIDLNAMGLVPKNNTESPHSVEHNRTVKTQRAFEVTDEEGIQEQEPWECDQDELEQELRQINERLSHRRQREGAMSRAFQTQKIFIQKDEFISNHEQEPKQKEVKTVRLSLTPPKVSPYKSRNKSPRPEKIKKQSGRCRTETSDRSGVIKVGVKGYKR